MDELRLGVGGLRFSKESLVDLEGGIEELAVSEELGVRSKIRRKECCLLRKLKQKREVLQWHEGRTGSCRWS